MSQALNKDEEKNSMYIFQGHQFSDYIDVPKLKSAVKEQTGFEEEKEDEPFATYYSRFLTEKYSEREILERVFFESIFYGRLTNVFINKIKNPMITEVVFKQLVKRLIEDMNSRNNLTPDVKRLMTENGFYIMDLVYTTEKNTFLAGYDYTLAGNHINKARFLVVQVVPIQKDGGQISMRYLVCAIEIDYTNQTFVVALKNMPNIVEEDDDENSDEEIQRTVMKAYKKFSTLIITHLQLQKYIKYKKDRTSMFEMCKYLDNIMLDELRQEVETKTSGTIKALVDTATEELFGKPRVPLVNKENLKVRFNSLLLATYLDVMTEDDDLIYIAKHNKLVGYPTKVSFRSKNSSKGATGTSGANEPVATSVMFHSLYTDFQEALELPNWSLSWFKDINHLTHSTDVCQTSVVSTKENFKVTFINKNHIGKELFLHVVRELSKYRCYNDTKE
ncbi:hypothetical protein [Peribacillus sp. N1]